ncbi:hypothetical protein KIN20_011088 [Parelaphostrongylus tenuis]|uniref:Uncharacterized protein n=1 Tax=Parelaphostrongylus tenuis TaxID=148309 RepID=A0AAD5MDI2_PARTN|nr:hypothetical protein KIN20_011088 [Parelaphostrongylus tenuis]
MPLIIGRVIAFISCCLYLSVELLTDGRRYLMMFCYILLGIATSSSSILRSYIAAVSATGDRARAYSVFVIANMFSILVGPICQLMFSSIRYPGFVLIEGFLKFHIFSAPIWIATLTNFVSVAIIHYGLKDVDSMNVTNEMGNLFDLENVKALMKRVLSMDLNWPLILLCWLERMLTSLNIASLYAVFSPFFQWVLIGVGVLATIVSVAFIVFRFGNLISPRCTFLIAVSLAIAMYAVSYPYEFISHKMQPYNKTIGSGCDTRQYTWCDTAYGTLWPIFVIPVVTWLGTGVSLAAISLDTTYSKVLGKIDQNIMQGAMVVADDASQILGPVYAASLFTSKGLENAVDCK